MRSLVSKAEFRFGAENRHGSHATADGVFGGSWQIGAEIPEHCRNVHFVLARLFG